MKSLIHRIEDYTYPIPMSDKVEDTVALQRFSNRFGLLGLLVKLLRLLYMRLCDISHSDQDQSKLIRLLYQPFTYVLCSANDWAEREGKKNDFMKLDGLKLRMLRQETQEWVREVQVILEICHEKYFSITIDRCDNVTLEMRN